MTKQEIPWELLAKHFAGELSRDEEAELDFLIRSHPVLKEQMPELRRIWKDSGSASYTLNVDEAWKVLSQKMDYSEPYRKEQHQGNIHRLSEFSPQVENYQKVLGFYDRWKSRRGKQLVQSFTATAAAILIIIGATFFYSALSVNNSGSAEQMVQKFTVSEGQRATYTLQDGSRVILHAESTLEVPENFGTSNRELYLNGEALFEVNHDENLPFIVRSETSQTRVLGTKFLVQAWSHDDNDSNGDVEVVVTEGIVAFGSRELPENQVVITENQKAVLRGNDPPSVTGIENMDWYTGWTTGRLVFDNRTLNEIIPKLERWYVLDIRVENEKIGSKRLSAEIDYDQPMTEVLHSIALSLDLEFERNDRQVIFGAK